MADCKPNIERVCANPDDADVDGPILDLTTTGGTLFTKFQQCKIDLDIYRYAVFIDRMIVNH